MNKLEKYTPVHAGDATATIEITQKQLASVYSNGFMDRAMSLSPTANPRLERPQSISK